MMIVLSFFVFFFKQETAYELRISDWSSDVCSSDLVGLGPCHREVDLSQLPARMEQEKGTLPALTDPPHLRQERLGQDVVVFPRLDAQKIAQDALRSDELRVGTGCVSKCKSRGAPSHENKQNIPSTSL